MIKSHGIMYLKILHICFDGQGISDGTQDKKKTDLMFIINLQLVKICLNLNNMQKPMIFSKCPYFLYDKNEQNGKHMNEHIYVLVQTYKTSTLTAFLRYSWLNT